MRPRTWLLAVFPLLWIGPLALGYSVIRVYMTGSQGDVAIASAWTAFLAPLVATVVALAKVRPLGILAILWLGFNCVLGFLAFAFVAVMSLQT